MPTPITVKVLARAEDADHALQRCRTLPAYRKILESFPSDEWQRRWVKTDQRSLGLWSIEFQVEERPIILLDP